MGVPQKVDVASPALIDLLLAHAVVGQLDVALVVEQDIVQLKVQVNDAPRVEVVQGQHDLGTVE